MWKDVDAVIVYISIGNSDDKMSQREWSEMYRDVDRAVRFQSIHAGVPEVHGAWVSEPSSPWQNACWCVALTDALAARLRRVLSQLAGAYGQDSIAWAEAPTTEFLGALGAVDSEATDG
jgi:hypothetical protein